MLSAVLRCGGIRFRSFKQIDDRLYANWSDVAQDWFQGCAFQLSPWVFHNSSKILSVAFVNSSNIL